VDYISFSFKGSASVFPSEFSDDLFSPSVMTLPMLPLVVIMFNLVRSDWRTSKVFPATYHIPYHTEFIETGVTGIAEGMRNSSIASTIQITVAQLIMKPNFPRENVE
jgi:hypothetical protein